MMKIVRYIVPVMGTPGEQGNLLGQVTVRISIDHSDLVAVMQCIGAVVSKVGLYAVPLIKKLREVKPTKPMGILLNQLG